MPRSPPEAFLAGLEKKRTKGLRLCRATRTPLKGGVAEYAGSTKSTQGCNSTSQTFTATFGTGTGAATTGSRQIVTHLDRSGHVTEQTLRAAP